MIFLFIPIFFYVVILKFCCCTPPSCHSTDDIRQIKENLLNLKEINVHSFVSFHNLLTSIDFNINKLEGNTPPTPTDSLDVDLYWRDYNGTIPSDAYPTGHGTYIAQIFFMYYMDFGAAIKPGTFYPESQVAVCQGPGIQYVRLEFKENIKLLCTSQPKSLKWKRINVNSMTSKLAENYVSGGYKTLGGGEVKLYIGKLFHEGEWKIGEVVPPISNSQGLNLWGGKNGTSTSIIPDFEILTKV